MKTEKKTNSMLKINFLLFSFHAEKKDFNGKTV